MSNEQMNNQQWTPPPPPDDKSPFSDSTREHYESQIKKDATKALVFGVLCIFCCPPIFAYFAHNSAQDALTNIEVYEVGQNYRGLAQAGKILSIIGIVLFVLGIILRIFVAASR